jgi:hypothetical protein
MSVRGLALDVRGDHAAALEAWREVERAQGGLVSAPVLDPLPKLPRELPPAIDPDGGPAAVLVGGPGEGSELVASLMSRLDEVVVLDDRFRSDLRRDGFTLAEPELAALAPHALHTFVQRFKRGVRRLDHPVSRRHVDWLPWLDVRSALAARAAFGGLKMIRVVRQPQDALLNWIAFGCAQHWRAQPELEAVRALLRLRAHLQAAAAIPGVQVLEIDPDAAAQDVHGTLERIAGFLGAPWPNRERTASLRTTGLGGLPVAFPRGHHAAYATLLAEPFALFDTKP